MRLTDSEPTRRPAASKARPVTVQQQAVARAAISPAKGNGASLDAGF